MHGYSASDPREGSGVIPNDWLATLSSVSNRGAIGASVRGKLDQNLRNVRALAGTVMRNYDYDVFWLTFPLNNTLVNAETAQLELVVRISNKEGHVRWSVSAASKALLLRSSSPM